METAEDQFQFFDGVFFETFGREIEVKEYRMLTGGNINVAVQVNTDSGAYFIKYNTQDLEGMFEAESRGLDLLRETKTLRIPEVVGYGRRDGRDYMVLEYIQLSRPRMNYWETLGHKLANMHRNTNDKYGLHFNNYIGSLRQSNEPNTDWVQFFIEKRLNVQAGLALYNELISWELYDEFQQFYKILPDILPSEKPTLLHGDLWTGNIMADQYGEPCLIDPAVYYGNREAEMAFTTLFGGFDSRFYQAYHEANPLQPRFDERVPIYNMYPLLVHVNLFGTSYLAPVEKILKRFL
jgi:protein-ribulosamine 3-kinase